MKSYRSMLSAAGLLAGVVLVGGGCSVIESHEEVRVSGRMLDSGALVRIEPGISSENWVIATYVEPSRVEITESGQRVLVYQSSKTTHKKAKLLFVFDASSHVETDRTVFIECTDGVVSRFWRKGGSGREN